MEIQWTWADEHEQAFLALKDLLISSPVFSHFDESRPLYLSCDASPYGIGAVLAQLDDQGLETPIAFAICTLGSSERNYAQLDKEGLAIVFGVVHFHRYIAGRKVVIFSNHKPLLGIFEPSEPMPAILSPRMVRWCLTLGAYDYDLQYRPAAQHANADALSRLPLPSAADEPEPPGDILMIEAHAALPLTAEQISKSTQNGPVLHRLFTALHSGEDVE